MHNNVSARNCHRTVHREMHKMVTFMLCVFYHNKKIKKKQNTDPVNTGPSYRAMVSIQCHRGSGDLHRC